MYLCVDIGGTKTLIASFSNRGLKLKTKRFKTNKDPEAFLADLEATLKRFNLKKATAISIALPGAITYKSGTTSSRSTASSHKSTSEASDTTSSTPLLSSVRSVVFGNLPWPKTSFPRSLGSLLTRLAPAAKIYALNDADAAALYEAARFPEKTVVYLTFSTGIGGGIVKNGSLSGKSASFEPGHKLYRLKGLHEEWEDLAAASAIRRVYGHPVTALKDQAIMNDIAVRLSLGLSDIIKEHEPDIIVIGGPLAFRLPRFVFPLRRLLAENLPPNLEIPRLLRARRPTESVIYGLYLLGRNEERKLSK